MNKAVLPFAIFLFSAVIATAQTSQKSMAPLQKEQAAKADVYIINSKKKISDSLQFVIKDSATVATQPGKRYLFRNKKSS
jgi:hypothetical protein